LKGDKAGMEREVALSRGMRGAEDWIAHSEALVSARSGKLEFARRMSRRAVDLSLQAGQHERAATFQIAAAVWEGFVGNLPSARQNAMAALKVSKGRDVEYAAGFALALSGDSPSSQALADDLASRFPEDTEVQFIYVPVLRAFLGLRAGEPRKAIELLQTALPYDLAVPNIYMNGFFGSLYPAYVRGLGYLAMRQGPEAVGEFRKILDHHGMIAGDPIGALARLQLGRALVLSGDTAKAKAAYQDFLTLWKGADPDIPILDQAKKEFAKLQ
jgi:eukaryotic-like serine/threonine-protein kinase